MELINRLTKHIEKDQKFESIDAAKFIMAIFVIAIHTQPFENFPSSSFVKEYDFLVALAVPFFFIASGYFIYSGYFHRCNEPSQAISYLKNKLKDTIKKYLLWTLLYLPLTFYGFYYFKFNALYSFLSFLRGVFIAGENFLSWPLWYLLALITSTGLIYLLFLRNHSIMKSAIVCLLVYLAYSLVRYILAESGILPSDMQRLWVLFDKYAPTSRWFDGMPYIFLGLLTAKYQKRLAMPLCIALFVGSVRGAEFVIAPFSGYLVILRNYMLFHIIIGIRLRPGEIYAQLRKASVVIYFTHMYAYAIYAVLINREAYFYGLYTFLFTCISTSLLSLLMWKLRTWSPVKWLQKTLF